MKTPTALYGGNGLRPSSLSLSNVDINKSSDLEKSFSNLFLHNLGISNSHNNHSTISLKNAIKKTKTLPMTNSSSNKLWKFSKFSKSCKSVNDCCDSDNVVGGTIFKNARLRKKLSQSLKTINNNNCNNTPSSPVTIPNNTNSNKLALSLKQEEEKETKVPTKEILEEEQHDMNITENYDYDSNYAAQILSDPGGAGNFRSMDELRILQSGYHSDR